MEEIPEGYTRVSSILQMLPAFYPEGVDGTDFKWDYPFKKLNPEMLQRKKDIGTEVHAAIAADAKGEFYPLEEAEKPYFESYLKWKNVVKPQVKFSEKRFNAPSLKLSGCIDMIIHVPFAPMPIIVDFKTSASEDPFKWRMQAAFYAILADLNGVKTHESATFLQLNNQGNMPRNISYRLNIEATTAAMSAYNLFNVLTKR